MDAPRPAYREMTDPQNRNILGTFNNRLIGCAQRSIARGLELEIPEKIERVLDFLTQTAGLDGRGREALRDALMGQRTPVQALGTSPLVIQQQPDGVPRI